MDDWNQQQHGSSGLLARVRASEVSVTVAEAHTLEFLAAWVPAGASPMCALERFFHYRNLDVSTLKELARRWAPRVADGFAKEGTHLALADILESIRELKHYRAELFAPAYAGG